MVMYFSRVLLLPTIPDGDKQSHFDLEQPPVLCSGHTEHTSRGGRALQNLKVISESLDPSIILWGDSSLLSR